MPIGGPAQPSELQKMTLAAIGIGKGSKPTPFTAEHKTVESDVETIVANLAKGGYDVDQDAAPDHAETCVRAVRIVEDIGTLYAPSEDVDTRFDPAKELIAATAKHAKSKQWVNAAGTWSQFIDRYLATPDSRIHTKDGYSYLQGSLGSGKPTDAPMSRAGAPMHTMQMMVFDLDDGGDAVAKLKRRAQELGLCVIIHETYGSRKDTTIVDQAVVAAWLEKAGHTIMNAGDVTDRDALAYWNATASPDMQGSTAVRNQDGDGFVVTHRPIIKARVILPAATAHVVGTEGSRDQRVAFADVWKAAYHRVASILDIATDFDTACTDPNRVFFAARRPAGADFAAVMVDGYGIDLHRIIENATIEIVEDMKARQDAGLPPRDAKAAVDPTTYTVDNLLPLVAAFGSRMTPARWFKRYQPDHVTGSAATTFVCPFDIAGPDNPHRSTHGRPTMWIIDGTGQRGFAIRCWSGGCTEACKDATGSENGDRLYYLAEMLRFAGINDALDLVDDPTMVPDVTEAEREAFFAKYAPAPTADDVRAMLASLPVEGDKLIMDRVVGAMARMSVLSEDAATDIEVAGLVAALCDKTKAPKKAVEAALKKATDTIASIAEKRKKVALIEDRGEAYGGAIVSADETDALIHRMNERFAHLRFGSKDVVLLMSPPKSNYETEIMEVMDRTSWQSFNKSTLGKVIDQEGNEIDATKYWLSHPDRRRYEGVTFDPIKTDTAPLYNLYKGYSYTPEPGDWSRLRRHLYLTVCRGNLEVFIYVWGWLAQMFQDARAISKPGTALVVHGVQGSGKSLVFEMIGELMAAHYLSLGNGEQLTGRFTGHFAGAILVVSEEASFPAGPAAQVLKNLITALMHALERKGKDIVQSPNLSRIVIITNKAHSIAAEEKSRRFCVLETLPDNANNEEYFLPIVAQMNDNRNAGRKALLHDLIEAKLPHGINLRIVPQTESLDAQKHRSLDSLGELLMSIATDKGIKVRLNKHGPEWLPLYESEEEVAAKRSEKYERIETAAWKLAEAERAKLVEDNEAAAEAAADEAVAKLRRPARPGAEPVEPDQTTIDQVRRDAILAWREAHQEANKTKLDRIEAEAARIAAETDGFAAPMYSAPRGDATPYVVMPAGGLWAQENVGPTADGGLVIDHDRLWNIYLDNHRRRYKSMGLSVAEFRERMKDHGALSVRVRNPDRSWRGYAWYIPPAATLVENINAYLGIVEDKAAAARVGYLTPEYSAMWEAWALGESDVAPWNDPAYDQRDLISFKPGPNGEVYRPPYADEDEEPPHSDQ